MPPRSRTYGWYILGLLATVNSLNYANRNVVFPVYDDLRAAFAFSNAELGLLGTAFMLSHALVTVPIGWAGDRLDRRKIMALGLVVWSLAALASALAVGLGSMLISRALVGVGTATCVPIANALLADVFPQEQKARTISIFSVGVILGGGIGFAVGAMLGFPYGFVALALPGIALALLVYRLDVPPSSREPTSDVSVRQLWRDVRTLLRIPTMRWLVIGGVLMAFSAGGYVAWFADFVANTKGYTMKEATGIFGSVALTGGLAGVVTGGIVGDRLYRRVAYGRLAAISMGFAIAVPFALVALFVDGALFLPASWLMMFFITWYHGPMAAVVDDLVSEDWAATGQAAFILLIHLVGTAPSSYVVGVLADATNRRYALLAPTIALGLAALAVAAGFRTVERDCQAASVGEGEQTAL